MDKIASLIAKELASKVFSSIIPYVSAIELRIGVFGFSNDEIVKDGI